MKTLTPETYVRLAGWHKSEYAKFSTVRGYTRRTNAERTHCPQYQSDPEARHQDAVTRGHATAFANFVGHMLVNDPSGAWHKRELERSTSAIELTDGEIIAVEGEPETYKVRVIKGNERGPKNADPIHFDKVG